MGFLNKLTAAAKDAKQTLEKTGLLDALKDSAHESARDTAEDVTGIRYDDGTVAEPVDWSPPAAAARYNVVNPYTLVTTEELSHLTGIALTGPQDGGAENMIGGSWQGQHGKDTYRFGVYTMCLDQEEGRQRTPRDAWDDMRELRGYSDDATEVDGVGDEAFLTDSYLYVRKGNTVLMVDATVPERYDAPAALRNIAIAATNRLPAMPFDPPALDEDGDAMEPHVAALPDPATLVSDADMRALTGLELEPGVPETGSDTRTVTWAALDGARSFSVGLYAWHREDGIPTVEGARTAYREGRLSLGDQAVDVPDVGDEACCFAGAPMVIMRKGVHIVQVAAADDADDGAEGVYDAGPLTAIAAAIAARLP